MADETKRAAQLNNSDSPMLTLIWGAVLLGGIVAFIAWGLTHAYPGS